MRCALLLIAAATACSNESGGTNQAKPDEQTRKLAGVFPDRFSCNSIATPEALGQALGGTVNVIDTPSSVPRGVAKPCNYEVIVPNAMPEYWTFDFDCRDNYQQTADALFAQYAKTSAEQVDLYNAITDAGPKEGAVVKRDAGVKDAGIDAPQRAPELSAEVAVGKKGLDHHGQGLLFVDDDAPCYVRVVGPEAAKRLELAKLIAKNLTYANAPMTPRPFK